MSFDGTRLMLYSEARIADRPEIILKDPICDTMTLGPGDGVGVAIVNADVLLQKTEAREESDALSASTQVIENGKKNTTGRTAKFA